MIEQAHSPLGPSSAARWLVCPGSVLATKDLPDEQSIYAAEGTAAHILSQWCRVTGDKAEEYIGRDITVGIHKFVVDREMADAVQEFVDYCEQFGGDAFYEQRVCYDEYVEDAFGTVDDIRIAEPVCRITDLKFGVGVKVFAKENEQLMLYAIGVYQDFGYLYDIEEFVLAIHQPRLDHVDEWTIGLADLLEWAKDVIVPGAQLALTPGAQFKAGTHCQFCRLKAVCRTRYEWVFDHVVDDFENLDAPVQVRDANLLTNADVAIILPLLDPIRGFCKNIEARAMREIQQGHAVGDYKLVEGRSNRAWRDADNAALALEAMIGTEAYKMTLVSPAQAEKLIGKKHPLMAELVHKPPGHPKLAPGSDPRPTLVVDAETEFENLDAGDFDG